jgi:type 1 glutamine amidotransferase
MKRLITLISALLITGAASTFARDWVEYEGKEGPGLGKHIVFVTGDEEYRSEEGMPMLAKILAVHHGFKCTVLFAINPADGTIDPNNSSNVVGLEKLKDADMMVVFTRFREFPDDKMKYFVDFVNSGKPILGLRTATHAFQYAKNPKSPFAKYTWNSKEWLGGFGRQVLGDTWINHHGNHGSESTRGVLNPEFASDPILRGVHDIWGPTDVYGITHLPANARVLVHGQVLAGMTPSAEPVDGPKNNPMMPVFWVRTFTGETGHTSRVIGTTMGAATDLVNEGLRRILVNSCYWGLGMEDKIPAHSDVRIVGDFNPTPFGFNKFVKGRKPADHELH